jgi:hypothetical protein
VSSETMASFSTFVDHFEGRWTVSGMVERPGGDIAGWHVFTDVDGIARKVGPNHVLPPVCLVAAVPAAAGFVPGRQPVADMGPPEGSVWLDVGGISLWDLQRRPRLRDVTRTFRPSSAVVAPTSLLAALRARFLPTVDVPEAVAQAFEALCGMRTYLDAAVYLELRRRSRRPDQNRLATWEIRAAVNERLEAAYRVLDRSHVAGAAALAAYEALWEMDQTVDVAMASGCTVEEVCRYAGQVVAAYPPTCPHRLPDDVTAIGRPDVSADDPHVVWLWGKGEVESPDGGLTLVAGPTVDSVWGCAGQAERRAREIAVAERLGKVENANVHIRVAPVAAAGPQPFEFGAVWLVHVVAALADLSSPASPTQPGRYFSVATLGAFTTRSGADAAAADLTAVSGPTGDVLGALGRSLLTCPSSTKPPSAPVAATQWLASHVHTVSRERIEAAGATACLPKVDELRAVKLLAGVSGVRAAFVTALPFSFADSDLVDLPTPLRPEGLSSDAAADLFVALFPDAVDEFASTLTTVRSVIDGR